MSSENQMVEIARLRELNRELVIALEWALHRIRMPIGVNAENWASQYNQAFTTLNRARERVI